MKFIITSTLCAVLGCYSGRGSTARALSGSRPFEKNKNYRVLGKRCLCHVPNGVMTSTVLGEGGCPNEPLAEINIEFPNDPVTGECIVMNRGEGVVAGVKSEVGLECYRNTLVTVRTRMPPRRRLDRSFLTASAQSAPTASS